MEQHVIDSVLALRAALHGLAERSGEEIKTKAALMAFLREHTTLRLEDEGQWFCAVHEEGAAETVGFRGDMDALPFGGGARHLCGHDGHSAALAGLGLLMEGKKFGRNVVLIFQHAEETGEGGKVCCLAVEKHRIDRVYAFHNIPGWAEGAILLRRGTFACASRGMILAFAGAPSHAAYPEFGKNPGFAAARLISAVPALTDPTRYEGLTMATLVGAEIGTRAFGSAAGNAEVRLTLRAWHEADMRALTAILEETARAESARDGVTVSVSFCDVFPATVNDPAAQERLERVCAAAGLACAQAPEPFRWSEDFGYYGAGASAAMAGIGAGKDWPQLHTDGYEFNDAILPAALTMLQALAQNG